MNRYTTKSGSPSLPDVENYLGRVVDYVIPVDGKVTQSANLGQPLMMSSIRWNKAARQINSIVDSIEQMTNRDAVRNETRPIDPTSNGFVQGVEQNPSMTGLEEA